MPNQDALQLKGYAQVFQPRYGQLGTLINAAQRQKQFDQEMALKKRQADEKWLDDNLKLNFPNLRTELQTDVVNNLQNTYKAMTDIYKADYRMNGGLTQEGKNRIRDLKIGQQKLESIATSIHNDTNLLVENINKDKELYDMTNLSANLHSVLDEAIAPDRTINERAASNLVDVLKNPDNYNMKTMVKRFQDKVGTVATGVISDKGNYFLKNDISYAPGIFDLEEVKNIDGQSVFKPRMVDGKYVPSKTQEALSLWLGMGNMYEQKLQKMVDAGQYKNMKEAFDKEVVSKFDVDSKPSIDQKSQWEVYGPSGKNPKDFNFQVSAGNFGNLKNANEIKNDGLAGTTSKSIDMQGLIDEKMVFKGPNNEDIQGKFMGFYTDENGKDAIGIQPYNNGLKSYNEETKLIPLNEKNRTTVRNTITNPQLRQVFDKGYNDFKQTEKQSVVRDESKLQDTLSKLEQAFDGRDDADIAESVRKTLLEYGIKDVEIGANQKTFPWGWNSIKIEGQDFDLSNDKSRNKLKDLIYDIAKNQFSKVKGKSDFTPEDPL